ncbi:hypothetical protein CPB84DRAFT_1749423 [Gymnopilus junonius]|uniref:Uncharacterized protein n=1 Tax=Gymnopilus junonius TaxID=109634 RepID=A0A9P5NIQ8_GYMJU|nr:hypothetical protein CPB84DRAFT_1749423 [Gymnopilus junonius]
MTWNYKGLMITFLGSSKFDFAMYCFIYGRPWFTKEQISVYQGSILYMGNLITTAKAVVASPSCFGLYNKDPELIGLSIDLQQQAKGRAELLKKRVGLEPPLYACQEHPDNREHIVDSGQVFSIFVVALEATVVPSASDGLGYLGKMCIEYEIPYTKVYDPTPSLSEQIGLHDACVPLLQQNPLPGLGDESQLAFETQQSSMGAVNSELESSTLIMVDQLESSAWAAVGASMLIEII